MSFPTHQAPRIISTADASMAHGCKVMVYGNAGTGKTRLCASAPAPIILSAERGLLSLRQFNLPAIEIENYGQLIDAYNWLASSHEARQFATVCLDTVSEIAEVVLGEEKQKKNATAHGRAWGETADQLVKVFRNFRDLPRHVYFGAKQEYAQDGTTGARYHQPSFPGQALKNAAPYFFDEVFQLVPWRDPQTGINYRFLRTQPDNQNVAKDRSGVLNEWENADPATGGGLTYLFNKMLTHTPQT